MILKFGRYLVPNGHQKTLSGRQPQSIGTKFQKFLRSSAAEVQRYRTFLVSTVPGTKLTKFSRYPESHGSQDFEILGDTRVSLILTPDFILCLR